MTPLCNLEEVDAHLARLPSSVARLVYLDLLRGQLALLERRAALAALRDADEPIPDAFSFAILDNELALRAAQVEDAA